MSAGSMVVENVTYRSLMGTMIYFFSNKLNLAVHLRTLLYPSAKLRQWLSSFASLMSHGEKNVLSLVQLLIEERTEDVHLLGKFWIFLLKVFKPQPNCEEESESDNCELRKNPHLSPNSIKVSFKNSPGCNLATSPLVMLTLPGTSGG